MGKTGREPIATVELCAHVWVVVVGDSRIGPVYVESEANDIAESINAAHAASIKQAVNAKLEALENGIKKRVATVWVLDVVGDEIRKLKED